MGKNSSKITIQQYISRFQVVDKDQAHNLTYLKEKRTSKQFLLKQIFVSDKQSLNFIQIQYQRKKLFNHQHITQLIQFGVVGADQFCSTLYHCRALYQFPFRTLQQQRKDRIHSGNYFQQDQLLSILASLVLGFSYFQKNYVQHQSVRSSNIYVDHSGIIKISDPYAKQLQTNFQLYRHYIKPPLLEGVYLSPNQLKSLKDQQKYPIHNPYKSDVFCLGIVLLQLSSLKVQDEIFNISKGLINQSVLLDKIEIFGKGYGNDMKKILSMMLCLNESQRLDWNQLEIFVKKQQKKNSKNSKRESINQNSTKIFKTTQSPKNSITMNRPTPLINIPNQRVGIYHSTINSADLKQGRTSPQNLKYQQAQRLSPFQRNYASNTNIPIKYSKPLFANQHQIQSGTHKRYIKSPQNYQNKNLSNVQANLNGGNNISQYNSQNMMGQQQKKIIFTTSNSVNLNSNNVNLNTFNFNSNNNNNVNIIQKKNIDNQVVIYQNAIQQKSMQPNNQKLQPMQLSQKDSPIPALNLKMVYNLKSKIDQNFIQLQQTQMSQQQQQFTSSQESRKINTYSLAKDPHKIIKQQPESQKVSIMLAKDNDNKQQNSAFNSQAYRTMQQEPTKRKNIVESKKISLAPVPTNNQKNNQIVYVKQVYKQGAMYEGNKFKGMRHGQGKFYYKDGGMYEGEWNMNKMQGYGKLFYTNSKLAYEGNWKDDHFHGYGKLYNEKPEMSQKLNYKNFDDIGNKWKLYEGEFEKDLKHGKGILTFENGERYEGSFSNDKINGEGVFKSKGGIINGRWQLNKLMESNI